ncbi:MAG: PDZ domain-containing protein [bacterium]|nr:PDZ domain-containing protein [bacterium]
MKNYSMLFLFLVAVSFSSVFAIESDTSNVNKGIDLEEKINKTPWTGLITKDYLKEKVKKKEADGVLVDDFIEKGPAKISGINKGDIIKSIDGQAVMNQTEFENAIYAKKVGDKIKIKLMRETREIEIEVTLEDTWNQVRDILDKLGFKVKVIEVSDKPVNIVISDIKIDSLSYNAKLEKGDLLLGINRKTFRNLKEFGEVTSQVKLSETVFLTIIHNGSVLTKELSMNAAETKK